MGNFGSFWGGNGNILSFSVKNGRFWPFDVPGKVAPPENYFDRRVWWRTFRVADLWPAFSSAPLNK
jgi:hypothetical protein